MIRIVRIVKLNLQRNVEVYTDSVEDIVKRFYHHYKKC